VTARSDRSDRDLVLTDAAVLDADAGILHEGQSVLIRAGRIAEVGDVRAPSVPRRSVRGMTVMPGLIDAHVHAVAATADLAALARWSPAYRTAHSARILAAMVRRGFTTVRDVGGADYGLAAAVEEGLLTGPRLLYGGRALSQTGGHGDLRGPGDQRDPACGCTGMYRVCDGVDAVRVAARDELRKGAYHLKLMVSGGIASPTDRIDSLQFSDDEIRAAVAEAAAAGRYVAAHAYTAAAVNRALRCGVRSIEHGNLMDESSVPLFVEAGAYYVPTLATYAALAEEGREAGLPQASSEKVAGVLEAGLQALELAHRGGVTIAFGSDLLGSMHGRQLTEFGLRAQVQPAADVIRSATTVAARLVRMETEIGVVAPGAQADLIVLDGNPLEDLSALSRPDRHLRLVIAAGRVVVDSLDR
jgi:imidazolonepropionase-like amidohydrolase